MDLLSRIKGLLGTLPEERIVRQPEAQLLVDQACSYLAIYHSEMCSYCNKVRRAVNRLMLTIEYRDIRGSPEYSKELLERGGKLQVPCLRITDEDGGISWLYESEDIILYLEKRFPIES